jgi:alkylhydroperoxidase family enzyme
MAWIKIISEGEADGLLKRIYDAAIRRAGKVFNILKVQSQNPPVLQTGISLYREIMHGESPLSRVQREMLATVVSRINNCHY